MRRALLVAAAGAALAGCGTPSADLFVVERSGSIPGARLTLRFDDGGEVRCNGGEQRKIGSDQLITARDITRKLNDLPRRVQRFAPGPGSVLTYRVKFEDGDVRFSDTSRLPRDLRPELQRLALLTRQVAKDACGLAR